MIYVVCFIHVIYWLKIGSEPILSLMLFEMPIIFFISGASLSFRKEPRSFWNTLCSRFKRVVIPYYIYAVLMIALVAILTLVWHLWFILPYLILSCSFEIQKRILTKINRGGVQLTMYFSIYCCTKTNRQLAG